MDLHLTSCIIFISCICIFQTSQLPLKNEAFYYPTIHQGETINPSSSNYFVSGNQREENDNVEYSDYEEDTDAPLENFESEKIIKKPSDIKKLTLMTGSNESHESIQPEMLELRFNKTPSLRESSYSPTNTNLNSAIQSFHNVNHENANNYSKFIFSSPSATVTSNGPSGPFKAIICHDCENSGKVDDGRHYSVSFSAIKSWNVGNNVNGALTKFNESSHLTNTGAISSPVKDDQVKVSGNNDDDDDDDDISRDEQTTQKYDYKVTEVNHKTASVPVENQGSYFESQVSLNDSGLTPKLLNKNNEEWNYSLLTVRNENINVNDPLTTTVTTTTIPFVASSSPSKAFIIMQKKPIFNDLLKVPYDVLNAPLPVETPTHEPIKETQIHINHQQKLNDTITNYQHFQQFIQKNSQQPSPTSVRYYQSTPMPEQNYEVDESVSLMTNGRVHGVQSTTQKPLNIDKTLQPTIHAQLNIDGQDAKFGVVFEGRDFRKYKVEEKTADGFIVGEYGYLSITDGSPLFGVRYTADSNINPQLIYDALLKFIKL